METEFSLRREIAFLFAGAFSFAVVGTLGSIIVAHYSVAPGAYIGEDSLALVYWLRWGGKIVGRFFGDLICGFVLGRYLRRVKPSHALLSLLGIVVVVIVMNHGFSNADDGMWVRAVGATGAIIQLILQVTAMAGVVAIGIWMGRRSLIQEGGAQQRTKAAESGVHAGSPRPVNDV